MHDQWSLFTQVEHIFIKGTVTSYSMMIVFGMDNCCEFLAALVSQLLQCTTFLRNKYGVTDYQYLENGSTQQCNIFRHNEYNFYLVLCEISTPYVKM